MHFWAKQFASSSFFWVVVRNTNVLQTNAFFAVIQHMCQFVKERKPHRETLFKTIVQLNNRNILVPTIHAMNRCVLEVLHEQHTNANFTA